MIYHVECYQKKHGENRGCPANHCPLILPLTCDDCQKEIKGNHVFANCPH